MISKVQIKHITSLHNKKYRDDFKLFCIEGVKNVEELIKSDFTIINIYATKAFIPSLDFDYEIIEDFEMAKISALHSPSNIIAVVQMPTPVLPDLKSKVTIALDGIQDPGNFGTIIRIADWFGIENVLCSLHCADLYNSKTIQSTMGSFTRVKVHKVDLDKILLQNKNIGIYTTQLNGMPLQNFKKLEQGIIVIGNEGKGISEEIKKNATHKIYIPGKGNAESLNAAVACGIICSHLL